MQGLTDGPRSGLTEQEVLDSLSFQGGATVSWGLELLDITTGDSVSHDLNVKSGSVDWSYRVPSSVTGRADLEAKVRRTGSLVVSGEWGNINPLDVFYQVYVEIQSGSSPKTKWYLGTFVSTLPPMQWDGKEKTWDIDLADKTHLWNLRKLTDNYTIPFNRHILLWIQEELNSEFGESTYDFPAENIYTEDDLFIDEDTSYLDMFNVGLEHKGYEPLTVTAEGLPKTRDADDFYTVPIEHTYETNSTSTVVEGFDRDPVLAEAPNVLKFVARRGPSLPVEGNGIYTIYNYDVGVGSINSRGFETPKRVEVEADSQAELEKIARRDANAYFMGGGDRVQLSVGLNPRHDDRDIIGIVYPEGGLTDPSTKWAVTSWSVSLPESISSESDVTMDLEAERLWTPPA